MQRLERSLATRVFALRDDRLTLAKSLSVAAFVVPLAIYAASLLPGVGFWDTAEMQTVPYIFGVAHPPGFPAFVMLGYFFSHVFAFGNVAWRLSFMSALALAGAAWLIFRALQDEDVHPILACLCAWAFAFGYVVWTRATRAEVHALALFFMSAAVWSALRARASGAIRPLYICALSLGLAAATHPVVIWIVPGTLVLLAPAFAKLWRTSQGRAQAVRVTAIGLGLAIAPLLLYLYMPLRSAIVTAQQLDPTRALGLPPGQAFWDYGHTVDPHRFILQITGAQFPTHDALRAVLSLSSYPTFAAVFASKAWSEFGIVVLMLAALGTVQLFFKDRIRAFGLALIILAGVPFALSYLIEIDYDRYLLTAYWGLALLAGIGAQALLNLARGRPQHRVALVLLAIILAESIAYEFKVNRDVWTQRHDRSGEAFIDRILRETPPRSVVDAPWVFEAPLAYAAYVEHRAGGRLVTSSDPRDADSRLGIWIKQRPVYVIYFEIGPGRVPGLRFVPVDLSIPALYRVEARD